MLLVRIPVALAAVAAGAHQAGLLQSVPRYSGGFLDVVCSQGLSVGN